MERETKEETGYEPTPYIPACSTCRWRGEKYDSLKDAQRAGSYHRRENPDHKIYTIGGIGHHPV